MNNLTNACFGFLFLLRFPVFGQSSEITLYGFFEDWTPELTGLSDIPEVNGGVDILEFQVTNDQDFLYLRLLVDDEVRITDNLVPHNLYLYPDTDGNSATGYNAAPGMGAELGINFYTRTVYYNVDPPSQLIMGEILLRVLPTHSANEFEFAINRHVIPDGITPLVSKQYRTNTVSRATQRRLSSRFRAEFLLHLRRQRNLPLPCPAAGQGKSRADTDLCLQRKRKAPNSRTQR